MKTSPTTSSCEARFRTALLDVLHAQWRAVGIPFNSPLPTATLEVVDPEALLWCSLEFLEDEPRLEEGVRAWFAAHRTRLITQRINKLAGAPSRDPHDPHDPRDPRDPRALGWHELAAGPTPDSSQNGGRASAHADVSIGRASQHASSLFLRSRDVLGRDCRSFLIVFLIGAERGVRLREVRNWTGYSYRTISEAVVGWERAGIVRVDHGHCVLTNATLWRELLRCENDDIVTVDWSSAYHASIELLRMLAKARQHGLDDDHALIASAVETTRTALESAAGGIARARTPALALLRAALTG